MHSHEKSVGHICFAEGYEYFWAVDQTGSRIVAKAPIASRLDSSTSQRIGARFEGTEAWFNDFGSRQMPIVIFQDNKSEINTEVKT